MFKPYFFEVLNKEKEAYDGVRDVRGWLEVRSCLHTCLLFSS